MTQAQWQAVVGENPSEFKGPDLPVENVSHVDCQEFIDRLNRMGGLFTYRLPTEAEWEYACRAGYTTDFCFGDEESRLGEYAWFDDNSGEQTHPVGKKKPNAWGLYDMHGNVFEWCQDWYRVYPDGPITDPIERDESSSDRVLRGGCWDYDAGECRSASRQAFPPDFQDGGINGFRFACDYDVSHCR